MARVSPRRWIPGIVIAAILTTRCNDGDNTVAGPDVRVTPTRTATLTPTPRLPGALDGSWHGTVKDHGATEAFFCPPHEKAVRLKVHHSGEVVGFLFILAGCSNNAGAEFAGFLSGESLVGFVDARSASSCMTGSLSGRATANHIELHGSLDGPCNSVIVDLTLDR